MQNWHELYRKEYVTENAFPGRLRFTDSVGHAPS